MVMPSLTHNHSTSEIIVLSELYIPINTPEFLFPKIPNHQLVDGNDDDYFIATYQNLKDKNQKIILRTVTWDIKQEVERLNSIKEISTRITKQKSKNDAINQILIKNFYPVIVLSHKYYLSNNRFSVVSDFSYQGRIFDLEISNQKIQSEVIAKNFANQSIKIIKDFIELNQTNPLVNPSPFKQNIN
jgi:hypothetical protein